MSFFLPFRGRLGGGFFLGGVGGALINIFDYQGIKCYNVTIFKTNERFLKHLLYKRFVILCKIIIITYSNPLNLQQWNS